MIRPASATRRIVALAAASALAACTPTATPKPQRLLIAATFYPLYEFSRQVAGDRAEVVTLVPHGVEPHDWEPSARDLGRLDEVHLLVYNGAGLEPWIGKLLAQLARRGVTGVDTAVGLPLLPADDRGDSSPRGAGPGGAGPDPHVWLDPTLAQAQVDTIRRALERLRPSDAAAYAANAGAFAARLRALDQAFQSGLRECARRDVVVTHAAFGYLTRRYGLTQVALMGLAPEAEPSPAQLARIVRLARARAVAYVFTEPLVSPKLAAALAREVGARTLVLNPIEARSRDEEAAGKGYVALMEDNLQRLRTGLECR